MTATKATEQDLFGIQAKKEEQTVQIQSLSDAPSTDEKVETEEETTCISSYAKFLKKHPLVLIVGLVVCLGMALCFVRPTSSRPQKESLPTAVKQREREEFKGVKQLGDVDIFGNSFRTIKSIISPILVDETSLTDLVSPQFRALTWISTIDDLEIPLEDEERIIQRYVLAVFYFSTGGKGWKKQYSFLSGIHECSWNGVRDDADILHGVNACDESFKVTSIVLDFNGLEGNIPGEVKALRFLTVLRLSHNQLNGPIPEEMGEMPAIRQLVLTDNQLSGPVPQSLQALSLATNIWLDNNTFTGSIDFLCQHVDGAEIRADREEVQCSCCGCCPQIGTTSDSPSEESTKDVTTSEPESEKKVPKFSFEQVKDLVVPSVSDETLLKNSSSPQSKALRWIVEEDKADLSLENPDRIIQRYILAVLYYSTGGENWIEQFGFLTKQHECDWGEFKEEFELVWGVFSCDWDMAVTGLVLGSNSLVGTIPAELGMLENLAYLALSHNALSGGIPYELGNLLQLEILLLASNELSGQVPQSLLNCKRLDHIRLENNQISGSVDFLCDGFDGLDVHADRTDVDCKCCPCCPEGEPPNAKGGRKASVRKLIEPVLLDPAMLDISGSPQSRALQWVTEEDPAQISLSDPERLIQRYNLAAIYYGTGGEMWTNQYNFLSARHECDWNEYEPAADLILGVFSCDTFNQVSGLVIIFNKMQGSFPTELLQMPSLGIVAFSGNFIHGPLPQDIGKMQNLQILYLENNDLTGEIPSSMATISSLTAADFHKNSFTGSIDFLCNALVADAKLSVDRREVTCSCCTCCPET